MNVSLTPELRKYVAHQVKLGHYQTASEVVRAGLRLLQKGPSIFLPATPQMVDELADLLNERMAALDRGEGIDGKLALKQVREGIKRASQRRKKSR